MPKDKVKPPMEFSKKMLVWSYMVGIGTVLFAMIMQIVFIVKDYQGDTSIITALLVGGFAEMSIVSGVYGVKAKMENVIKLKSKYKVDIDNEDFNNDKYE